MKLRPAQNFRLLVKLLAEHPKLLLLAIGSLLIVSLINLSIPSLIKDFVGVLPNSNSFSSVLKFSGILLVLFSTPRGIWIFSNSLLQSIRH